MTVDILRENSWGEGLSSSTYRSGIGWSVGGDSVIGWGEECNRGSSFGIMETGEESVSWQWTLYSCSERWLSGRCGGGKMDPGLLNPYPPSQLKLLL
jgi:hypothetical protein